MVSKDFYTTEEAADKLSTSAKRLSVKDVLRLSRKGHLPVCFEYQGYLAAFPSAQNPVEFYVNPGRCRNIFYFSGYLRNGNYAESNISMGCHGKVIDLIVVAKTAIAVPDASYADIEIPGCDIAFWPTDENGRLQHLVVRSKKWLFHVDDLEKLIANAVSDAHTVDTTQPQPQPQTAGAISEQTEGISIGINWAKDEIVKKPWLVHDSSDPEPAQGWYTTARYFARQSVIADSVLLEKRLLLAQKVSKTLATFGFMKRGEKLPLDPNTVLKAFSNVNFR